MCRLCTTPSCSLHEYYHQAPTGHKIMMDKQKNMYSILACFLLTFFMWGSGNTFWFGREIVIIFWGGSNETPPWSMQPQPWFALYYYCFCWCSLGTMLRSSFYFKPRSVQCNATLEFEVSVSANLDGSAKANAFLVQLEHDRF